MCLHMYYSPHVREANIENIDDELDHGLIVAIHLNKRYKDEEFFYLTMYKTGIHIS